MTTVRKSYRLLAIAGFASLFLALWIALSIAEGALPRSLDVYSIIFALLGAALLYHPTKAWWVGADYPPSSAHKAARTSRPEKHPGANEEARIRYANRRRAKLSIMVGVGLVLLWAFGVLPGPGLAYVAAALGLTIFALDQATKIVVDQSSYDALVAEQATENAESRFEDPFAGPIKSWGPSEEDYSGERMRTFMQDEVDVRYTDTSSLMHYLADD